MSIYKKKILLTILLLLLNIKISLQTRYKRSLVFPTRTWVQMVLGFGLPFEVDTQDVTIGPFVKSLYYVPSNASDYTNASIDVIQERKKRAANTRWNFYNMLSNTAKILGYGGKPCVLRTICEIAEIPFSENYDIFTEIFHVIFTPSTTLETVNQNNDNEYLAAEKLGKTVRNCAKIFPECKVNLMDSFTKIISHLN